MKAPLDYVDASPWASPPDDTGEPYEAHASPPYWALGLIVAGIIAGLYLAPWVTVAFVAGCVTATWAGR